MGELAENKQWVTCVDDKHVKHALTKGERYQVDWVAPNYQLKHNLIADAYEVTCDDNVPRMYEARRFVISEDQSPEQKYRVDGTPV